MIAERRPRLATGGEISWSLSSEPLLMLPELNLLVVCKENMNI
mgnify:CR=1 FL=1